MKKIKIVVHNFYEEITTNGFLFHNLNASIGHNLLAQWVDFYEQGQRRGFELFTVDQINNIEDIDVLICLDRPSFKNLKINSIFVNPKITKYLVTYENSMIYPANWEAEFHNQFKRIYTWNDDLVDNVKYFKINYATQVKEKMSLVVSQNEFEKRKLCGMISGAKYLDHPNSIYQERIDIINWFQQNNLSDFDLWGRGWEKFNLPCYRGETSQKLITGNGYRFLFALENAKGFTGYISEKIFDAYLSGSIPVYMGAPNVSDHIPKNTFIAFDEFNSIHDLFVYLKSMTYETYCHYLKNIDEFLSSAQFDQFSIRYFTDASLKHIEQDCIDNLTQVEPSKLIFQNQIRKISVRKSWNPKDLIIAIPYGFEMPLFMKARSLWESFRNIYSDLEILFFRGSNDLQLGEVTFDRGDLVVGTKCEYTNNTSESSNYAQMGSWGPQENFSSIFRQVTLYHHLLRTRKNPFYLYHSTITSVVDFRGLAEVIAKFHPENLLAGMPGRLGAPELNGLTFVCGTNNLVSSDIVQLMAERYKLGEPSGFYPNDIWQAITLKDVKRKVMPFFTISTPVDLSNFDEVHFRIKVRKALKMGHFHFRVKTHEPRYSFFPEIDQTNYRREDVDPILMRIIMDEIIDFNFEKNAVNKILDQLSEHATNSHSHEFNVFEGNNFMSYKPAGHFACSDVEI